MSRRWGWIETFTRYPFCRKVEHEQPLDLMYRIVCHAFILLLVLSNGAGATDILDRIEYELGAGDKVPR